MLEDANEKSAIIAYMRELFYQFSHSVLFGSVFIKNPSAAETELLESFIKFYNSQRKEVFKNGKKK